MTVRIGVRDHGIRCPHCGVTGAEAVDTRHVSARTRRIRRCSAGHRFTTYERPSDRQGDRVIALYDQLEEADRTMVERIAAHLLARKQ